MSFIDLFSKQGRKERSLQKNCSKAADKKIKPMDRKPSLYALLEEARGCFEAQEQLEQNPDNPARKAAAEVAEHRFQQAVTGLLRRFTFSYDTNMVEDEEEKNMAFEGLVELGSRVLPQIKAHLKTSPTLSWGLRLLTKVCDHETTWETLAEILQDYDPEYERDPTRKLQLMTFLGEFQDARATEALLPFLEDHDETVRYVTAESLFKQGDERAREPLLRLMTSEEEESLRIKNRIAEGFKDTGWVVKGFRGTVEKVLSPEYVVDGKGRIKLKKARE